MSTTADDLLTTVFGVRRLIRRRLRARLPGLVPLRGAQIELLRVVEVKPGIGVAAAARALHLAGNSVSTLVNQLVEAGMLTRSVDAADRRAARLELTEAARDRLATWRTARSELMADTLATLSEEDTKTIEEALPALRRLMAALEEET
ncbi:winged helix-turn-helix transcriptional regulator [Amycolatopsis sp. K13G38]|uniref:Winged helix-turn-helix transcriptional regulator n=1 Tax=Amycolatopsis acididurans TaxID=2724524 RepID=A0ABX1J4S2_9PSEU|nr:MarR family winged helix-turn-helix transcriptional regulator [Amycolatopsis acididurans]NKQ54810.1 winged helix-turn-helix transcriptional regulator [Amycolatopsis acididurans]